jgi:hypothetical protein
MFTSNVNLRPTIAERYDGVLHEAPRVLARNSQGFPIIYFVILSKQNNSASTVPSVAKKVSLYLAKHEKRHL